MYQSILYSAIPNRHNFQNSHIFTTASFLFTVISLHIRCNVCIPLHTKSPKNKQKLRHNNHRVWKKIRRGARATREKITTLPHPSLNVLPPVIITKPLQNIFCNPVAKDYAYATLRNGNELSLGKFPTLTKAQNAKQPNLFNEAKSKPVSNVVYAIEVNNDCDHVFHIGKWAELLLRLKGPKEHKMRFSRIGKHKSCIPRQLDEYVIWLVFISFVLFLSMRAWFWFWILMWNNKCLDDKIKPWNKRKLRLLSNFLILIERKNKHNLFAKMFCHSIEPRSKVTT